MCEQLTIEYDETNRRSTNDLPEPSVLTYDSDVPTDHTLWDGQSKQQEYVQLDFFSLIDDGSVREW